MAEAGSWQCIQGCSHPQLLAAAPVKPQPHCKTPLLWNRKEWGAISSASPPWCFLTRNNSKLVQGSWKRDCVIMEMMVVPAPNIQKSWVGLSEVIRSLKIRKVVFLSILAAVLTPLGHMRYWMHILDFSEGLDWYNHKPRLTYCSENITSLFLVALLSTQHIWHLCIRKLNLTLIT